MKNKSGVLIGIFFVFIILISFYFDSGIIRGISLIQNNLFDSFFLGLTFLSSKLMIVSILTILFLSFRKKRRWVLPLWFTLALSGIISFLLKFAIQRPRPFQLGIVSVLPILEKASHLIWNFSFPSSHAMIVFSILPLLNKEFSKLKYLWIIFALSIAFSRVYFGLHFLSDVIAGGLIGYVIGTIILKTEEDNKFWCKIYNKITGKK